MEQTSYTVVSKELQRQRIIEAVDKNNEIDQLEDGFCYYFPRMSGGAISAFELRIIADELDHRNKEVTEQLMKYFEENTND